MGVLLQISDSHLGSGRRRSGAHRGDDLQHQRVMLAAA